MLALETGDSVEGHHLSSLSLPTDLPFSLPWGPKPSWPKIIIPGYLYINQVV